MEDSALQRFGENVSGHEVGWHVDNIDLLIFVLFPEEEVFCVDVGSSLGRGSFVLEKLYCGLVVLVNDL